MRVTNSWWAIPIFFVGAGLLSILLAFEPKHAPPRQGGPEIGPQDSIRAPPGTSVPPSTSSEIHAVSDSEWSRMTPAERTELLMVRFTRALERLEQDRNDVTALQEAQCRRRSRTEEI